MKQISTLFIALCLFVQAQSQMVVFADDYAAGVSFAAFGGSVNNLTIDGAQFHTGTKSLKIVVPAGGYTGGALVAATPQNLSAYNAVTFWAKNDATGNTINGAGLGNNATTTVYAVERNGIVVTSTWTKYYIPIPVAAKLTAETGLFHFAESEAAPYNLWIDDIQYETVGGGIIGTPTAAFATESQNKEIGQTFGANGTVSTYPVNGVNQEMQTAKSYFTWTSSNTSVATFDNATGIATALAAGTTSITGMLGAVTAAGTLSVTVTAPTGPSTAAPTPNRLPADVKSLFSNSYSNIAVETWSTSWSNGFNTLTDLQVAGNDTKKYQLNHFVGVEFINAPVDGTVYNNMHIDVWAPVSKALSIRLVNFDPTSQGVDVVKTPAANQWVSYDIPLSSFGLAAQQKLSQMLFLVDPGTSGTFFIDNVYFYKSGAVVPTEPATAAPTPPARNAADVISLFSNAYTDVSGTEWFPNWGQSTVVTDVNIAGNATKKYTNINYQGVNFTPAINAGAMAKLHLDLWTANVTAFDVFLINPGPVEQKVTLTPTIGEWNSFDIDLNATNFPGINFSNIFQFKLEGRAAGGTVFLDNIYFHKGSPLPVSLSGFNVTRRGNTSVINWKTFSESNSKGFSVERSSNGTDWKELQFVNSGLNSAATKTYSSIDKAPVKGINYYRLKQVDNDGKFTYSSVASLKFLTSGMSGFSFYPNPAKNKITVLLETINSGSASLQLTNAEGKMVRNVMISNRNSDSNISIDISSLTRGLYYIILKDGPSVQTTKVLVD